MFPLAAHAPGLLLVNTPGGWGVQQRVCCETHACHIGRSQSPRTLIGVGFAWGRHNHDMPTGMYVWPSGEDIGQSGTHYRLRDVTVAIVTPYGDDGIYLFCGTTVYEGHSALNHGGTVE